MRLHTEVDIGFWIVLDGGSTTLPQACDVCLTILTSLRLGCSLSGAWSNSCLDYHHAQPLDQVRCSVGISWINEGQKNEAFPSVDPIYTPHCRECTWVRNASHSWTAPGHCTKTQGKDPMGFALSPAQPLWGWVHPWGKDFFAFCLHRSGIQPCINGLSLLKGGSFCSALQWWLLGRRLPCLSPESD